MVIMGNLSEEEIKIVDNFTYWYETNTEKGVTSMPDYICKGLLDLYNREKSNNKELMREYHKRVQEKLDLIYGNNILNKSEVEECYINKDKIIELKLLIHKTLDDNGITRGYQIVIDDYFDSVLKGG